MDVAVVGGCLLTGLRDVTNDLTALDRPGHGRWVVVLPFDAPPLCARFDSCVPVGRLPEGALSPVDAAAWTSSLDEEGFGKGVEAVREAILEGDVYQVNLCRRLSAPVGRRFDILGLAAALARRHRAPHAATVVLRSAGVAIASASPELFLRRRGDVVESCPIKGTAAPGRSFLDKDTAENVMIVDLVRNDLGRVCRYGTVEVPDLCREEHHPGLAHLVSTVRGRLRPGTGWADLLGATFPPGSVTGAPKLAARDVIRRLEPVPRGVYCGAVGWVDTDSACGDLNVAIRTFWVEDGRLHLGTGGGITWGSTPRGEWEETELKARRLLSVAAGGIAP
ncbi:MAG TPA: anthranilate synthase component I family protein [Acidimicrobiales bacterium]|nr:anthranilate synthase component I family protein [Acidimicrobiales bacterium]